MRRPASVVSVVFLAAVCTAASATPPRPAGSAAGPLLRCAPSDHEPQGNETVADPGREHVVRNGAGDELALPPNAVPRGTRLQLTRRGGVPNRIVVATASAAVGSAALTIDFTGCDTSAGVTMVRWAGGGVWEDVGGTVSGSSITATLEHLSIYALAGT